MVATRLSIAMDSDEEDEPRTRWCCCCGGDYAPVSNDTPEPSLSVTMAVTERTLNLPPLPSDADATQSSRPGTPSILVSPSTFSLPEDYDPQREYVRHYLVDGYTPVYSTGSLVMRQDSFHSKVLIQHRAVLQEAMGERAQVSPRDVRNALSRLALQIRVETDLEKRQGLITEYEAYKNELDRDNPEDAEKARFSLNDARNTRLDPGERLGFYRNAVRYTNETSEKEKLRLEYVAFCERLKNRD